MTKGQLLAMIEPYGDELEVRLGDLPPDAKQSGGEPPEATSWALVDVRIYRDDIVGEEPVIVLMRKESVG